MGFNVEATELETEHRLGPFGLATVKPYSRTRRSVDGSALMKVYLGIDPEGRRLREVETVGLAAIRGFSVPAVLATGQDSSGSWTVFRMLPGTPCSIGTDRAIEEYLGHVLDVAGRLHQPAAGLPPGSGWTAGPGDPTTQSCFLLAQLSGRCRTRPWWAAMEKALQPLESHPVVHLHGDLKPEHLLVDGGGLHVVDWEASGRGPAVVDYADVVFHLIRDLIYEDALPGRIPVDRMSELPLEGPVLAWRLLLWLDRRRPSDLDLISTHDVDRLTAEEHPAAACMELARVVSFLRAAGVPR
ncbi:aminoglycoside phosphotransferase family protein [Streptomyces sp. NRRL S-237]|uniref:aminoglycoside phosphotransferase family protein n=1 Tax=Streptomyces sp. NRRL S-237 TaxID=1463895 RepID=UPI000690650F|nr:aminoglycoside phosphotransferase family protein [Streptomyces sp. NRRL S-237]